jgi:peptidyl-prolyl cis-trans isomerase D
MLDTLRANSRSVLIYVLFGIIIVVFVISFGPGAKGCSAADFGSSGQVASVNGVTITAADFERAYRDAAEQGASNYPGLPQMLVQRLVDHELIRQEAVKHGLVIADGILSDEIQRIPAFQIDGRFDERRYTEQATRAFGSRAQFENRIRRDRMVANMLAMVAETVKVPEDEVKETWLSESDQVDLAFVRFPTSVASLKVKPTGAEVSAFLAANGARVEQFYKDNASRYEKKKSVRARHILVKVDRQAPPGEERAAHAKIQDLAERIKKGEDFAKLATEQSDDPGSKNQGGELPAFSPGTMVKEFEQAAFAMKPGEVSVPVRTSFGWHLIKVESIQEPETTPLDKVRADIALELLSGDRARKLADEQAKETLAKVKSGTSLGSMFQPVPTDSQKPQTEAGLDETGFFSRRGDWIPKLGQIPGLTTDALQRNVGDLLPKIYPSPSGPIVAVVKQRQRPDQAKFAEKKTEIADRLRGMKAAQVQSAWIDSLRKRADVSKNESLVPPADGPQEPPDDG